MPPQVSLRLYFDIPIAFSPLRRFFQGDLARCAVQSILGMLATGDLALCGIGTTIPELIYGHIGKDSLDEVWYHNSNLDALRKQIPHQLQGICAQCVHRDMCQGDCVASNYHFSGKLNSPFYFCENAERLGLFPASRKNINSTTSTV